MRTLRSRVSGLAPLALVFVACGGGTVPVRAPTALSYRLHLDPSLTRLTVEICPEAEGRLPTALVPIHEAARAHLVRAELVHGRAAEDLVLGERISLEGAPRGACARYVVDLSPRGAEGLSETARVGEDVFAPSSVWLLAPSPRDPDARYRATFELPAGVSSTPFWPRDAGGLWFDERAFTFVTYAAFGRFDVEPVAVPGGCLDVVTLDGALSAGSDARARWLAAAAGASARITGRVAFPRTTVLVVPGPALPDTPVLFGVAGRGVIPSVSLLVSASGTEAQLVPDWTAVHELTHLATAYVSGEDAWLSEGLATYYQEVLRARSGLVSAEQAWLALDQGFRRGEAEPSDVTLREASSEMQARRSYTHVYWSGAAIALLADVAYRRQGSSLDEAVTRAWPRREERLTAAALIAALDGAPDGPLARVAAAELDVPRSPSLETAYAWLGIRREGDGLAFDDTAPGAAARRSMMNDSPPPASIPTDCGGS